MGRIKANFTILAIETSLDDTCAAVTCEDRVLSNVIASQVKFHEEFGGTVPQVAKRKHWEWIDKTIGEAIKRSGIKNSIDAVAVTYGPGLAPCLEVGIAKAKEWAMKLNKPLIAVNHMEGHLLACVAKNAKGNGGARLAEIDWPGLGFLISGGHTELVLMTKVGQYQLLGETLDDAAGEAYDKVARMLNLGYPGGPILAELAREGRPNYPLPEPMRDRKDLDFSFSGLKTAARNKLRELDKVKKDRQFLADFAASFEQAVVKMLTRRLKRAIELYKPKRVWLGGGVVSNVVIRREVRGVARKFGLKVIVPTSKKLFTDNAAMIGVAGWYKARRGEVWEDLETLDRKPNLNFVKEAAESLGREE